MSVEIERAVVPPRVPVYNNPKIRAVFYQLALLVALLWRRQSSAVAAIEGRDGVEFWFDRTSPLVAPKLLRLPGLRRVEPTQAEPA